MKESLIYPGEYIPSPETALRLYSHPTPTTSYEQKPLVNMNETGDTITLEVALPGINRDQVSLCIRDNILSILVVTNVACGAKRMRDVVHEFDKGCMERHIVLPEHADTDFMVAEFKQGVLHLHIPKDGVQFTAEARQVIVY
jgi:HSP20 family molecular chaperone IbpA